MTTISTVILSITVFFGGIIISIIGYFLRKTMDEQKDIQILAVKTKNELDVLKNDHDNKHLHLSDKFDDLKDSIIILTREIKELTSKIK